MSCGHHSPNGRTVLNSHDAMILEKQPARLVVIGAGAIGIEFAYFFNAFGTEVTKQLKIG